MFKNIDLIVAPWEDYELVDSGDNRKLERFGHILMIRPETQALWAPLRPADWKKAKAEFRFEGQKGTWNKKEELPEKWEMSFKDARFLVKATSFKHTGIFPEQATNWEWIKKSISQMESPKVLNLFGYTGIASIVVAKAGAQVTHVDSSKQSNAWSKENALLSGVPEDGIRYILDDALKLVEREVRRGAVYDGIILDPPAFGRGVKGEVWKIEEDLPKLLSSLKKIFSGKAGSFFLLNGYAAGYSPASLSQAIASHFDVQNGEVGELQIAESFGGRVVPSGIYARFIV